MNRKRPISILSELAGSICSATNRARSVYQGLHNTLLPKLISCELRGKDAEKLVGRNAV